ncbi:DUF2147 domain-containing protein [uncultured Psychrobacter sp.]|uniref:DUF2147 domain-containing protein n=1 Tax=uncultured Psychrobacter sp. TaxID=259303 RepID=UPI0034575277
MNKLVKPLLFTAGLIFSFGASATDQLDNTKWTNYNKKGEPNAVLKFTEANGKLSAEIIDILDPKANKESCEVCKGKFQNKSLIGATVIWDLEPDDNNPNQYISGEGIDPKTGRTFSGKAQLEGDTLKLRGYKGVSLLGKTHILKRL